jgi:hypothetical protein
MQPVELTGHSRSSLIMVCDRFLLDQVLLHPLVDLSDLFGHAQAGFYDRTFTDRMIV